MADYSYDEILAGRRRLRQLLPWARAEARKRTTPPQTLSMIAKAQRPHFTEANLMALVIYPARLGGWHADLLLHRTPDGISDAIGTPVDQPCRTRNEAEERGKNLLATALQFCEQNAKDAAVRLAEIPPHIIINGWPVPLMPEIYATMANAMPDLFNQHEEPAEAAQRLGLALAEAPGPFHPDLFESWDHDIKRNVMAAAHMAALVGVYRFPPRQDASPSGHGDNTSSATH